MYLAKFIFNRAFGVWLLLMAALAATPLWASEYGIILFSSIMMYVVLSVSWTIFSGPTKYVSLASAAFFGIGIYTAAVLGTKLPLPLVIIAGGLAGFGLAAFVGVITLRLKGTYFVMFTFGLVELLKYFILWFEVNIDDTTGRVVPTVDNTVVFYIMLIIVAVLVATAYLLKKSKYGLALVSIGENEEAAAHIGMNVTALKIITFGLSAFFMGLAGAVMASRWTYIDPKIAFNPIISFMPVLMAIFGGMGRIYGPIIGAAIFTYLGEVLVTAFPYYYMLIFGIILVVSILFMPGGLVGLALDIRQKLSRR
jgi:branched-chain amino acid transport system permease protein